MTRSRIKKKYINNKLGEKNLSPPSLDVIAIQLRLRWQSTYRQSHQEARSDASATRTKKSIEKDKV